MNLIKWGKDRAKNVGNVASKAYDQVNVLDNNRTWEQRTPTNQKSAVQQAGQVGAQSARGMFGATAKTANTGLAALNVGNELRKTAQASVFGSDKDYSNAVANMIKNNNRYIQQGSGVLGKGSWFKDKNEATNIGTKDLAGRIVGAGAETYLEGKSLRMGGFTGKKLVEKGLKKGLKTQIPTIAKNMAVNALQGGVATANQGGNAKDIAKGAAIGGSIGTAADIGLGIAGAGASKVLTPAVNRVKSVAAPKPKDISPRLKPNQVVKDTQKLTAVNELRQQLTVGNKDAARSNAILPVIHRLKNENGIDLVTGSNADRLRRATQFLENNGEALASRPQSILERAKSKLTPLNEGGFIKNPLAKDPLDSLKQEARGYKSVDEFINNYNGSATQYGEYNPQFRVGGIKGAKRLNEVGIDPNEEVTIYRGIDDLTGKVKRQINDGDFVTADYESALAYTGSPKDVVSMKVKAKDLMTDDPDNFSSDPFYTGSEYIYSSKYDAPKPLDRQQLTDLYDQANKPSIVDKVKNSKLMQDQGGYVKNPFAKDVAQGLSKEQSGFINEYANMLESMGQDNGVSIANGKRISNNVRTADTAGKAMTKEDWFNEARQQIESGKAAYGAGDEYKAIKPATANPAKQLVEDQRMQQGMTGKVQNVDPELQSLAETAPKGFIAKETKLRNGVKDTLRVTNGEKGLKATIQSERGGTPQSSMTNLGDITNPLPVNPKALDIKEKSVKQSFMEATNKFLGQKESAKTNNVVTARTLPKLDDKQSLGLMDAVQQGAETGDFSGAPAQVRGILDAKYQQLRDAGVNIGYLQDYFPQKWANATTEEVNQAYQALNMTSGIMKERTIPTVQEGIALGYKPLTSDYRQAVANYLDTADKLIANRQYFGELQSKGLIAEAGSRPQGTLLIDAPGLPQPRPFTDPETGYQVQGAYYAKPDVAKKLNRMFGDQTPDGLFEKTLDKTATLASVAQDFGLSGGVPGTPVNAFTIAQATKEILAGNLKSPFVATMKSFSGKTANEYFAKNAGYIADMQRQGIPVRDAFSIDAPTLSKALSEAEGLKGKTAAVWGQTFNDPTFKRFMPVLQTEMFKRVKDAQIAKNLPEAEASKIAGQAVRNFYGLTSLADNATRNRVGNNASTTLFFAPKYREAMVRFWVNNGKALANPTDPAYRANLKFAAGAILSGVALDYMNQYGTGQHLWDNPDGKKDKALIGEVGGKQVGVPFLSSIATVPRNVASGAFNLATGNVQEAGKNATSFLGYGIRPVFDLVNNENYFGSQIVDSKDSAPQRLGQAASYVTKQYMHPYLREGLNAASGKLPENVKKFTGAKDQSGVETASKAAELPLRFYDPAYSKYGGVGLNKNQKQTFNELPKNERQLYAKSAIEDNKKLAKVEKEKDNFKAGNNGKELSNNEYITTINKKSKTFTNKSKTDNTIALDSFKKGKEKVKTIGDYVYIKNKSKTGYKTEHKLDYDYNKGAGTRKLSMDRAYENNNLNDFVKLADEELTALEKKKAKFDPETEQDEIDKITLTQENLLARAQGYVNKGYTKKGKGGKGRKGSKASIDLIMKANSPVKIPAPRKSSISVKAPSLPSFGKVKTPRVASRPRNRSNVASRKTYIS